MFHELHHSAGGMPQCADHRPLHSVLGLVETMKIPSLAYLSSKAIASLERFVWVLIAGFTCAAVAIRTLNENAASNDGACRLLLAAMLGLPLFFALTVYFERTQLSRTARRALVPTVGVPLLCAYYLS